MKRKPIHFSLQGEKIGKQLLVATGKIPNTSRLGMEKVGVTLRRRGEIIVDEEVLLNPFESFI
ncbi:MAG: hypothetical protein ACTSUQ_12785 [Candidatus Freyarchaeota archaeon]